MKPHQQMSYHLKLQQMSLHNRILPLASTRRVHCHSLLERFNTKSGVTQHLVSISHLYPAHQMPVALVQSSDVQFSSYPAHQTSSRFDPAHQMSRCLGSAIRCPVSLLFSPTNAQLLRSSPSDVHYQPLLLGARSVVTKI